jgi:hypothetical protein
VIYVIGERHLLFDFLNLILWQRGHWQRSVGCTSVMDLCSHSLTTAQERALHYAGMDIARLQRGQSVFSNAVPEPTYLIRVLSPLLFFAPDTHYKTLNDLYVDTMINHVLWNKFIEIAKEDWRDLTVMVSGNATLAFVRRSRSLLQATVLCE